MEDLCFHLSLENKELEYEFLMKEERKERGEEEEDEEDFDVEGFILKALEVEESTVKENYVYPRGDAIIIHRLITLPKRVSETTLYDVCEKITYGLKFNQWEQVTGTHVLFKKWMY